MADYKRTEAREWARKDMVGICGCLLPTHNTSLTKINEAAIRHDVRLSKTYGYWGTLIVPETGTTLEETRQVIEIAASEARSIGLRTMLLTSFPTLEIAVEMARYAEACGVDMIMPSYPVMFYPQTEDEVFNYTKTIAEATNLGVILFTIHHWNFARLHPSGFSPRLTRRLVDAIDNLVAIKNEIGLPGVGGIAEVFQRFSKEVVVTDPFEQNAPAWVSTFGMQFLGTGNFEYVGSKIADYFALLLKGDLDGAMEIYWRIHPARQVNISLNGEALAGSNLINRLLWKYQGWLNGFNGGPIRQPAPRISDGQMRAVRASLAQSGIEAAPGKDADFFVGRNPLD